MFTSARLFKHFPRMFAYSIVSLSSTRAPASRLWRFSSDRNYAIYVTARDFLGCKNSRVSADKVTRLTLWQGVFLGWNRDVTSDKWSSKISNEIVTVTHCFSTRNHTFSAVIVITLSCDSERLKLLLCLLSCLAEYSIF